MRIARVKRKNVNVMETAMNAENIMQSLNVRDLVKKVKRKHEWLHGQKTVNKWSLKSQRIIYIGQIWIRS